MATNIGLGYEAQLVNQVLQWRLVGGSTWTTVDSPVNAAKYRLDSAGTIVRLQYIGDWSYVGGTGPSGGALAGPGTAISPSFAATRGGSATDWTNQSAAPNLPAETAATTSAATYIEGTLNLTGHQIVSLAPSTTSTGAVNQQQLTAAIAAVPVPIPIEVNIVSGAVTNATGVLLSNVTIDASNGIHAQVTINLGTTTIGKRRKMQGFRVMSNGSERPLFLLSENRNGEAYSVVYMKTVDSSSSVNLILNA